jgi:hypothetical protein
MERKNKNLVALFVCTLIALFYADQTIAGIDSKIYPGIACHGYDSTVSSVLINNFEGRVENNSEGMRADVICPAINDHGDTVTTDSWAYVRDLNGNTGGSCTTGYNCDVYCVLVNHSASSTTFEYSSTDNTTGYNANPVLLDFGALSGTATYMRYMYCRLPPKLNDLLSSVMSYKITDNNP